MMRRITFTLAAAISILLNELAFTQAEDSLHEFQSGARSTFSTRGHPKAKGVEFQLAYPRSWKAEEGERPNVVQKFSVSRNSSREQPTAMATILIHSIPEPCSETEARAFFASTEFKEMLPPGAILHDARPTVIEQLPAGILEFTMTLERLGISMPMRIWSLIFFHEHAMVQIQFAVASLGSSAAELAQQMASYKPVFMLMANSIVLPKRWANTTADYSPSAPMTSKGATSRVVPRQARVSPAEDNRPLASDYPTSLIDAIVVGFFATWVFGLIPPLLIRYVFIRHPLSRKMAFAVAAGSCAFFWILFRVINIAGGDRPGTGFAWFLVFFVARWILSRESKTRTTDPNTPTTQSR